jgi:hypothetical protein
VCLRQSPTRTPAFLAANLNNAQKCTGPRTPAGKARSSLNALKHGRYARRLPSKLLAAGYCDGAALYARALGDIRATFRPADRKEHRQAEQLANRVYCMARRAGVLGTKPECPLFSATLGPRSLSLFPIQILDPWRRVGLVYWVQRKAFWNLKKLLGAVFGGAPVEEPPLRQSLESRIRRRVFRMKRPSLWDRQKYGLDATEQRAPRPAPQTAPESQTELDRLRAKVAAALGEAGGNAPFETPVASDQCLGASDGEERLFPFGVPRRRRAGVLD